MARVNVCLRARPGHAKGRRRIPTVIFLNFKVACTIHSIRLIRLSEELQTDSIFKDYYMGEF